MQGIAWCGRPHGRPGRSPGAGGSGREGLDEDDDELDALALEIGPDLAGEPAHLVERDRLRFRRDPLDQTGQHPARSDLDERGDAVVGHAPNGRDPVDAGGQVLDELGSTRLRGLEGVRVGGDRILGEIGQGFELTKDWFVEERLMIGARTVGAAACSAIGGTMRASRSSRIWASVRPVGSLPTRVTASRSDSRPRGWYPGSASRVPNSVAVRRTAAREWLRDLDELVATGRRDEVIPYFMTEAVGMPAEIVEQMIGPPMIEANPAMLTST